MTDQRTLLADYVNHGSEPAFRELVARYIDLVYSTAVRLVNGDTHRAEDVARRFTDFAESAQPGRAIGDVLLAQVLLMRKLLRQPREMAPWYNGTGTTLYVLGMMIVAFAIRG